MIASVILCAGAVLAAANAAESGDLAARVRQLVADLDSPELSQRQTAEAELLKLGPQVLDLLPRDAGPGQAEAAQRLGRIRQKLQRAQAGLGTQASQVTLQGKMPLANILVSLQQQTGNAISTSRLEGSRGVLDREFEMDGKQTPFWPALDQHLAKAGLAVYPYGEHGSIELTAASEPQSALAAQHVCYAGPLRFEVVGLVAQRSLRPQSGTLKIEIETAWEPRLAPISLKQRMNDVQAIDDRGRRLTLDAPEATLEIPVSRGPIASRVILPMALPPREAKAIAELRGTVSVLAPGPRGTFRFADLVRGQRVVKRMAGVSVMLEGATKLEKTLEIRVLVRFDDAGDALASHRTWIFNNPALLEASDGKTIRPDSVNPTRQTADEVGIALIFPIDRAANDYAFVYQTPTMVLNAPLEYRFRDIPLP
jgi:hypothetical protein